VSGAGAFANAEAGIASIATIINTEKMLNNLVFIKFNSSKQFSVGVLPHRCSFLR
jgi:hypothetical protein